MGNRYYTGVGSRNAPLYIMYMMSELAMVLEKKGHILRSGCATGADAAFEDLLEKPAQSAEIYVPNKQFPFRMGGAYKSHYLIPVDIHGRGIDSLYSQAMRMIHARDIHKAWQRCSVDIMMLHNRNMFQVLGQDLKTPSKFLVCYTRGKELTYDDTTIKTGGTATAINAAHLNNVDVFNLSVHEHYLRLRKFIDDNKHLVDYERLNSSKPRTTLHNTLDNRGKFVKTYDELKPIMVKELIERQVFLDKHIKDLSNTNDVVENEVEKTKSRYRPS